LSKYYIARKITKNQDRWTIPVSEKDRRLIERVV